MDSDEERNWVYCGMIKLLGSFLKEKRGDICLYIGFIGVFYVIFSLSNLPVDAVNYAFFLSAIWLLGYGIFKFNQYYKKGVAVIEAKQRLEAHGARARTVPTGPGPWRLPHSPDAVPPK